jgi:hypothetical protein
MKLFRNIIILVGLVLLASILHLLVYQFEITMMSISNVLFVVGIIVLLPSIIAITSAYRVFRGMKYVVRVFISPHFRKEYPTFRDYKEEKEKEINTTLFYEFFVAALMMIITSGVLAWMWFK